MNRPSLIVRSSLALSLLLALLLSPDAGASEISLRPFSASYKLYKGKKYIANTEIRLERSGDHWRWTSLTTARGIYAWFTRKQPYGETSFGRDGNDLGHQHIVVTWQNGGECFSKSDAVKGNGYGLCQEQNQAYGTSKFEAQRA